VPELPEDTPEHIREAMTLTLSNMALEAEKMQLTLQQVIQQARVGGMDLAEIERMLLEDLRTGGQLFGDFRANFKNQMRYSLEEVARGEIFEKHKDVKLWEWAAIADGKLCPDCANRNGRSMTLDEWRRIGLPGAGRTICQSACRCALTPAGSIEIPADGINRGKE
jgi:hypothetical protein